LKKKLGLPAKANRKIHLVQCAESWASEAGGRGGLGSPCILKISAKKVVFLISSDKIQISPLLAPPWKNFEKIH